MRRLPGHLVTQPEDTGGHAGNRSLARGRRGAFVESDIARQVEATGGRSRNPRRTSIAKRLRKANAYHH